MLLNMLFKNVKSCINFSHQNLPSDTEAEAKATGFITLLKKNSGSFK